MGRTMIIPQGAYLCTTSTIGRCGILHARLGFSSSRFVSSRRLLWVGSVAMRGNLARKTYSVMFSRMRMQGIQGVTKIDSKAGVTLQKSAADETLEVLEWPRVCAAVSECAGTTAAKELCNHLPLPSTVGGSKALQDETTAGIEFDSLAAGVFDFGSLRTPVLRTGLDRASRGAVCTGVELIAVAALLQFGQTIRRSVASVLQANSDRLDLLLPVANMVEPISIPQDIPKLIWSKLDEDGCVKDSASSRLKLARVQAHGIEQKLKELLNKILREQPDVSANQEIEDVDGRLCLVVPSSRSDNIPGLLFQRGTGVTAYLEPSAAVSLNNKLAEARAEVRNAEYEVLQDVTKKLIPHLPSTSLAFEIIVRLDVIFARAKYSISTGASRPVIYDTSELSQSSEQSDKKFLEEINLPREFRFNIRKARHPLLVKQHDVAVKRAKKKLILASKTLNRIKARAGSTVQMLEAAEAALASAETELQETNARVPVPIDIQVSSSTRVVAITGPNTGGKTAAIKTIGLAALMAKAGLYVLAKDPVQMPWFDFVLADIGDEQSLSQSLSTFSGHLMRIKRIKKESTENSLVLLDEVGAGTDPTEGASLGMALLESFAESCPGGSLLTFATTHHGELKTLKYSDARFENASVEFDEVRLTPTYRVLWGVPGRSNAINIARRLGLPEDILQEAEALYGVESAEVNDVIFKLEEAKVEFDRSLEQSEDLFLDIQDVHDRLREAVEDLHVHADELQRLKQEQLAGLAGAARSKLSAVMRTKASSLSSTKGSPDSSTKIALPEPTETVSHTDVADVKVGDTVYLRRLGRNVKVLDIKGKKVSVLSGSMLLKINADELL